LDWNARARLFGLSFGRVLRFRMLAVKVKHAQQQH
jgi:hypothetical protein